MHRVARLEGGDARPAQAGEFGARLGRGHEKRPVLRLEAAVGQDLERPGEIDLRLLHHHAHAGVLGIGGAEHRGALGRLVDGVLLGDAHRREGLCAFGVGERDTVADADRVRGRRIDRQRDGDRPENARRRAIVPADAFPVGVGHEPLERGEAADPQHDEVALLARAHAYAAQGKRAAALGGKRFAGKHERLERTPAVRRYQLGHAIQPARPVLCTRLGGCMWASRTRANCRKLLTTLEWNLSFG